MFAMQYLKKKHKANGVKENRPYINKIYPRNPPYLCYRFLMGIYNVFFTPFALEESFFSQETIYKNLTCYFCYRYTHRCRSKNKNITRPDYYCPEKLTHL